MLTGYGYVMCISIHCCIVCLLISAWALRCCSNYGWAMRRPLKCGTATVESTFFLPILNKLLTLIIHVMKRFLLLFFTLMLSVMVLWAYDVEIDGIYYNLDETNKSAEVTFGDVIYSDIIVLPSEVSYNNEKYEVTTIGVYAFRDCDKLKEVKIPISVQSIEGYAFWNSSITSITIPENVSSISSTTFQSCDYLDTIFWNVRLYKDLSSYNATPFYTICTNIKSIHFGENVEKVPQYLCYGMENLTSVSFPEKISSIGYGAFEGCRNLDSLYIPNSITEISSKAFYGCKSLKTISIGEGVRILGSDVFWGGTSISKVDYLGTLDQWVEINFGNNTSNPTYYSKDIYINGELLTEVENISSDSIKKYVFYNCKSIKNIEVGENIRYIDDAFEGCIGVDTIVWKAVNCSSSPFEKISSQIRYIYIEEGVEHIPEYLCYNMNNIKEINIPNSVTSIGHSAFDNCSSLNSVIWNAKNCADFAINSDSPFYDIHSQILSFTFGKEVESIPSYLCSNMSSLTEIKLPNSMKNIGSYSFSGCNKLLSLTIPSNVVSIGYNAFKGCSTLQTINWEAENCIDLSSCPFNGCYNLSEFIFANEVRYIPSYLCYGISIEKISIPDKVSSIGEYAFYYCTKLKKVRNFSELNIIKGEMSHGYVAYYADVVGHKIEGEFVYDNNDVITEYLGDINISKIEIPSKTKGIDKTVFSKCTKINKIIWNAKNCADFLKYSSDYIYNKSQITSITFGDSVEYIPAYICYDMRNLNEVIIGKNVKSIGVSAFDNCRLINKVNYFGNIDTWAKINFGDLDANPISYSNNLYINNNLLTDIELSYTDSIKQFAFYNCKSIKSVNIGESIIYIGDKTFAYCNNIERVNYLGDINKWVGIHFETPNSNPIYFADNLYINNELLIDVRITSADSIKKYAFYNCTSINSIELGESITFIDNTALYACNNLNSVIWNAKNYPDFSSSEESPFYNANISSFIFGAEVEHIPAYLCSGMNNLTKVNYLGKVDNWVKLDFNNLCDNPTYYAKDLYINDELLTNVKILSADTIKNYTFYNCLSIKSVEIGDSVTFIGENAFYNCTNLKKVINLSELDIVEGSTNHGCVAYYANVVGNKIEGDFVYNNDDIIIAYVGDLNTTEIEIPLKVKGVYSDVFSKCAKLNTIVWNAKNCKDFSNSSSSPFYVIRSQITSFTFGNEVEHIPAYLCYGMSKLSEVTIPNSVTSIGGDAFSGCSGLTKVNYLGTVDKWVEIDFKNVNSNPTYHAEDLYINNELLTDVKITTADSIKKSAFYNCQSIKSVEIGESVTSIGSSAFSGCDKLRKVTAYPTTVPNVYESSFAHYNAALYVPCDVYDDYFFDDVFGTFKVTECIAAEEVDAPDKVEIEVDEDNNAIVIWPSTDGAKKYELEISKDGEVFCTLLFNENGQLTSIDFGNRSASVGFQFTVTGLDSASKYVYSMVAMDKTGNELQSYKGTFTTNGYVPGPGEEDEPVSIIETLADANITVSGGTISADTDFTIYNTIGQNVTAQNGCLTPGVYVVKVADDIAKVMVQ